MKVSSESFSEGKSIPKKYTCQGEDLSPQLSWTPIDGAKAYALLFDDPDAPMGTWIHWRLINIPSDKTELKENEGAGQEISNSFGKKSYGGPCPPSGEHRYFFKIYALDSVLENVTSENFDSIIKEHTIDKCQIIGLYKKE